MPLKVVYNAFCVVVQVYVPLRIEVVFSFPDAFLVLVFDGHHLTYDYNKLIMRTTFPGVDSLEVDDDLERGFTLRSASAILHFKLDVLLYSMYAKGVHFVHSVALTHSYRNAE